MTKMTPYHMEPLGGEVLNYGRVHTSTKGSLNQQVVLVCTTMRWFIPIVQFIIGGLTVHSSPLI